MCILIIYIYNVYVYVYIYIYIYVCVCVYMCVCVYIYVYVCVYIHTYIYTYLYLGVPADEPLEPFLLEKLERVLLEREHDLGAAAERLALVLGDGEGRVGGGLPHPLLLVVVRL